jgi:thioredoxin-related protein
MISGTKEEITIVEKKFKEICSDPYNHRFGLKIQRDLSEKENYSLREYLKKNFGIVKIKVDQKDDQSFHLNVFGF